MRIILILAFLVPLTACGQHNPLEVFDNLVGKTWKAKGAWGDGREFSQEITFEYSLSNTIVIAKTQGFTDNNQKTFGPRSHGVRKYDKETKTLNFWEFDVFGGVTEGTIVSEGKNILYQYEYGGLQLTDMWEYVDASTYNFVVGQYQNGAWKQKFLEAQFKVME